MTELEHKVAQLDLKVQKRTSVAQQYYDEIQELQVQFNRSQRMIQLQQKELNRLKGVKDKKLNVERLAFVVAIVLLVKLSGAAKHSRRSSNP